MQASSIHIKPCKIGSAEKHNRRLRHLDYVRNDLSHLNSNWSNGQSLSDRLRQIKEVVKTCTGRSLQKKATPIREGVVVIKSDTSMSDIQRFAERCNAEFGITPLQISIHKDEGHYNNEQVWKPNLHAHIIFDWVDHKTGKSCKLNKEDMSKMQDILAEELKMGRGVSSSKKHLNIIQYKAEKEKENLKASIKTNENLKAQISQNNEVLNETNEQIVQNNTKIKKQVKVIEKMDSMNIDESKFNEIIERKTIEHLKDEIRTREEILKANVLLEIIRLVSRKLYNLITNCFRTKIDKLRTPAVIAKLFTGGKEELRRNDGNIDTFHCDKETGRLCRNGNIIYPDINTTIKKEIKKRMKM